MQQYLAECADLVIRAIAVLVRRPVLGHRRYSASLVVPLLQEHLLRPGSFLGSLLRRCHTRDSGQSDKRDNEQRNGGLPHLNSSSVARCNRKGHSLPFRLISVQRAPSTPVIPRHAAAG